MIKIFLGILMLSVLSYGISSYFSEDKNVEQVVLSAEAITRHLILEESPDLTTSLDNYWWLNSGGRVFIDDKLIKTVQGELSDDDRWRKAYGANNPLDTDRGYHPQNIFRLVTRNKWEDFQQQAYFKIVKDNFSASPNRNQSNGLLLFNRYQDGNTLYYTGLRVDGAAVIKKKLNGRYYTMAIKQIFPGAYSRLANTNLLPHDVWLGIRSEVVSNSDQSVSIRLFFDQNHAGNWLLILETTDRKGWFGGEPILAAGFAGIRTDFMDVEFEDYQIGELESLSLEE